MNEYNEEAAIFKSYLPHLAKERECNKRYLNHMEA